MKFERLILHIALEGTLCLRILIYVLVLIL